MTKRIFRSIFITALIAALLAGGLLALSEYNTHNSTLGAEIRAEAGYIIHALSGEENERDYFKGLVSENRVTLISPSGTVLYDSVSKPSAMENHLDRPEVASALESGEGESRRVSDTLAQETIYYARRTPAGNVLRVSYTQNSVFGTFRKTLGALVLTLAAVILIALRVSKVLSRRIVEPINELDLDRPLENDAYEELSPLLLRMEKQRREIADKLELLSKKQRDFEALSDNMSEGLVLLDMRGTVVTVNAAACRIFETSGETCVGSGYLAVSRAEEFERIIKRALEGEHGEAELALNSRIYELIANPVREAGELRGVLLLSLDVTDKRSAELSRREFTANVTHELKTPLTSISGYAEIIREGVAKPEDVKSFASRIYDEANRLVSLVDDILKLSQLDERGGLPDSQPTDLLLAAEDVCDRMARAASAANVSLSFDGESVMINAIPKVLDELIANLVDNAIKYNVAGGSVSVNVAREGKKAVLTVSDTGIGIPDEQRERVFERFYRVDKSHSKQTGGTGLGLAIVKHAAAAHGAKITLESEPHNGTTISVCFDTLL